MSWREVLAENFDTHNTHNTQNPIETHSSADIADIAYGNSHIPEDRDKARTVIEVALLPGVSYEEAFGWLSDVDIQLIEEGVYGTTEVRKFLVYENSVRNRGFRLKSIKKYQDDET